MKIVVVIIISIIIVLPVYALARTAGSADRRMEEIQMQATKKETGGLDGN